MGGCSPDRPAPSGCAASLTAFFGVALSWSFTTIAVTAKNVMTSVPEYFVIEMAFTVVQWLMVAPLTPVAFSRGTPGTRVVVS